MRGFTYRTRSPKPYAAPAGEAINPRNLSVWERWTGVGKEYNKQLDREDLYDDEFQASQAGGNNKVAAATAPV